MEIHNFKFPSITQVFVGWGFPILLIAALLVFDYENITPSDKRNPSFQYGNAQAAIAVFILVMCFFVTVGSLVLHQRHRKRFQKFMTLSKEVSSPELDITTSTADLIHRDDIIPRNRGEVNFTINANTVRQRVPSMTSSDDDILQNVGCSGNNSGHNNSCCTRSSTVTTVVDIEDLVVTRGSINADEDRLVFLRRSEAYEVLIVFLFTAKTSKTTPEPAHRNSTVTVTHVKPAKP
jgi:hypothetical protein